MTPKVRSHGSRRRQAAAHGTVAVGYASAPRNTALDGPVVDAQARAIDAACETLGLRLAALVREHEPGDGERRPRLAKLLDGIEEGRASCLVVSNLERLSRQVDELAEVVLRLENGRTRLIALDVGLDTATSSGRLALVPRDNGAAAPEAPPPPPPTPPRQPGPERPARPERPDASAAPSRDRHVPARPEVPAAAAAAAAPLPPPAPAPEPVEAPTTAAPEPAEMPPPAAPPPPAAAPSAAPARALGYASVPAGEVRSALLDDQRATIEACAERLGIELIEVVREREPRDGKALDRAGLSYLIERIAVGDASCVVVSGLDRLSRSVAELGTILQWLERNDVRLIAVDLDLDTASAGGHTTARALASVAGWERERLSERTRQGLAAARAKRHAGGGDSGPDWPAIRRRIATMRADGMTLQAIADALNAEGVPTMRGGSEWRPSSVQTAAGYRRRTRPKRPEDLPDVDRSGRGPDQRPQP